MRGADKKTEALFTYVTPETFVPKDHPLRAIRKMADEALAGMDKLFDTIYASAGRPSIPPEKLLNAQLLMILYSIRATGNLLSRSTTTSCSAGSWEWLWMRKSGITPASPRTVSDSLVPKLPPSFYPESSNRQRVNDCCCKSISPLMELSSKLGLRSRASSRKIPRMAPHLPAARTIQSTSRETSLVTKPTAQILIPMPASTAKERPKRRSSAIWGTL